MGGKLKNQVATSFQFALAEIMFETFCDGFVHVQNFPCNQLDRFLIEDARFCNGF